MLLAHDFKAARATVHNQHATQVVAQVGCQLQVMRPHGGMAEQLETVLETETRLKAELWRHIYGDIAKELRIAKDVARSCTDLHKCEIVNRAFATVERMLENPFIGVSTDKHGVK